MHAMPRKRTNYAIDYVELLPHTRGVVLQLSQG